MCWRVCPTGVCFCSVPASAPLHSLCAGVRSLKLCKPEPYSAMRWEQGSGETVPGRTSSPTGRGPWREPCTSASPTPPWFPTLALLRGARRRRLRRHRPRHREHVIHGCVASDGTLQIVSNSHACHKARGHGRRRPARSRPAGISKDQPVRPATPGLIVRHSEFPHGGVALSAEAVRRAGSRRRRNRRRGRPTRVLISNVPSPGARPDGKCSRPATSNNANPPAAAVICTSP